MFVFQPKNPQVICRFQSIPSAENSPNAISRCFFRGSMLFLLICLIKKGKPSLADEQLILIVQVRNSMTVLPDGEEHEALYPELLQLLLREHSAGTTGRKPAGLIILLLLSDEVEASGPSLFSDVVVICMQWSWCH